MGAWGSSLYANDCTSDVKDIYEENIQEHLDYDLAYTATINELAEYMNTDEEALVWIGRR